MISIRRRERRHQVFFISSIRLRILHCTKEHSYIDVAKSRFHDMRRRIQRVKTRREIINLLPRSKICLSDDNVVCNSHLFQRFRMTIKVEVPIDRVDSCNDTIYTEVMLKNSVSKDCVEDRGRVRKATCLNNHPL